MKINPKEIIKSEAFQSATNKAKDYVKNPEKVGKLIKDATNKTKEIAEKKKEPIEDMLDELTLLFRMVKAYFSKEYTQLPTEVIVAIIAAIIYFVSPIDFIPDFIPGFGLFDDVAVLGVVMKTIKRQIEDFRIWEDAHKDFESQTFTFRYDD